jgi:hypothetical protein
MIMTMVFQAAASNNVDVRVAAFNCLVEIASTYYDFMPEYITNLFMVAVRFLCLSNLSDDGHGNSKLVVGARRSRVSCSSVNRVLVGDLRRRTAARRCCKRLVDFLFFFI